MKLISLEKYAALMFAPGSAPARSTLRRQILKKQIPGGRKEVSRYYVDLDVNDHARKLSESLEAAIDDLIADPLLEGLF
jgi:hypothetical protein